MPKPVKKKKKFIRKSEATTYRLIPGYTEDEDHTTKETTEEIESRKEEQKKYGVFYSDDYNYMKHLRSLEETATLVNTESFRLGPDTETGSQVAPPLPFGFFSTDVTEEEQIDPEILEALEESPAVKISEIEEDELPEGQDFLDDDFIAAAGGPVPKEELEESEEEIYSDDDFSEDEERDDTDEDFGDEISDRLKSSEPAEGRGNVQDDIAEAQTALILKNFEEGLGFRCSAQMSDEEDEIATEMDYENLKQILKYDKFSQKPVSWAEVLDDDTQKTKIDPSRYLYEDEEEFEWKEVAPSKPKFDCVSILSLNSNTRNLPTDLIGPSLESRRKLKSTAEDEEVSSTRGLTLKQLEEEMRESKRADRANTYRPRGETTDEKKTRKQAIKDERKERRLEKKANKEVFALEKKKMHRETAALSKSVKSVKIS